MNKNRKTIGQRVALALTDLQLSQAACASQVPGLSREGLNRRIAGLVRWDIETLVRVSAVLNLDVFDVIHHWDQDGEFAGLAMAHQADRERCNASEASRHQATADAARLRRKVRTLEIVIDLLERSTSDLRGQLAQHELATEWLLVVAECHAGHDTDASIEALLSVARQLRFAGYPSRPAGLALRGGLTRLLGASLKIHEACDAQYQSMLLELARLEVALDGSAEALSKRLGATWVSRFVVDELTRKDSGSPLILGLAKHYFENEELATEREDAAHGWLPVAHRLGLGQLEDACIKHVEEEDLPWLLD